MRQPRDLSGTELAARPRRYGDAVTRQTGSHMLLVSTAKGHEHHLTIPRHGELRVGTLSNILSDVSAHREQLLQELFGG